MDSRCLAKKYRPRSFKEVVGQDFTVTTLQNALRSRKIAGAYLFYGPHGTGKTTLARLFAAGLYCEKEGAGEPCGTCSLCHAFFSGNLVDFFEIDAASNRGVDDIRQITEGVEYAPSMSRYKVYLIDEVHMITKEAANALLKTLEEPPSHVKFLLATTDLAKLPVTVVSRCQRFSLQRISRENVIYSLEKISNHLALEVESGVLAWIADRAAGSLRDAQNILDQLLCYNTPPLTLHNTEQALAAIQQEDLFALDRAIHAKDLAFAFLLAQKLANEGKEIALFIEELITHFHTLMKIGLGVPIFFYTAQYEEKYRAHSVLYRLEDLCLISDYLLQWQQVLAKSAFRIASAEAILLQLLRFYATKELQKLAPSAPSSSPSLPIPEERTVVTDLDKKALYDNIVHFAAVELEGVLSFPKG